MERETKEIKRRRGKKGSRRSKDPRMEACKRSRRENEIARDIIDRNRCQR